MSWQPIESAPRDGTRVFAVWRGAWGDPDYVGIAQWLGTTTAAAHWTVDGRWMPGRDPTHWMPLPTPPVEG